MDLERQGRQEAHRERTPASDRRGQGRSQIAMRPRLTLIAW
jgi:hypothetical protein